MPFRTLKTRLFVHPNKHLISHPKFCTRHTAASRPCQTVKTVIVTWIFIGLVALAISVLLVPVQDAPNEGGYKSHLGFSAGHSLSEWEQQGHVAVDAMFLLQFSARVNQKNVHYKKMDKDKQIKKLYFVQHSSYINPNEKNKKLIQMSARVHIFWSDDLFLSGRIQTQTT